MQFVEHSFAGEPTTWWIPNHACMEAMLRSAGFRIETRPETDVYICRCAERSPLVEPLWDSRHVLKKVTRNSAEALAERPAPTRHGCFRG